MKKILCTLPNASASISGIAFEAHAKGMLSVEAVEDDVADRFASIPGYEAVSVGDADEAAKKKAEQEAAAKAAEEEAAAKKKAEEEAAAKAEQEAAAPADKPQAKAKGGK